MNKFKMFLNSNKSGIYAFLGVALIFWSLFFLYGLPLKQVYYPLILSLAYLLLVFFLGAKRRHSHHKYMETLLKKPIPTINSSLIEPKSQMEKDYEELVKRIINDMGGEIEKYEKKAHDMNDYYSTWVHQIKTPIASMKLNLQAIDSENSRKLQRNLKCIEDYVDMVMSYLRLNSEHTDYIIMDEDIKEIVKESLKRCSLDFIEKKLSISFEVESCNVLTDKKWISLVIDQILSNCLKYTREGGITIKYSDSENSLYISDTGIGIDKTNLPRIFERGYTGFNGRGEAHSSGIGLYICKSVCDNLHVDIKCESEEGKGTTMILTFPKSKIMYD